MRGNFIDISFIVIHICHVNLFRIILIDKDVSFNKFDTFIMDAYLDSKVVA